MKHHHSILQLLALQSILVFFLLHLYSDRNIETAKYIDYDIPYSLRQSIRAHRQLSLSDTKSSTSHHTTDNAYTIPNLLLIGAQKAGTTSLAQWMFDSGDVCSGEVFPNEPDFYNKETHFFNEQKRYEQGIEFYAKRFEHCSKGNWKWWQLFQPDSKKKSSYIMDATPNTLLHAKKVHTIYNQAGEDALSKLKLIVILREPISREVSLYHHKKAEYLNNPQPNEWHSHIVQNNTFLTFDEYVDSHLIKILSQKKKRVDGIYVYQLKKWLTYFERKNLLILSYDELSRSPERVQNLVREFLGVKLSGCLKYWNAVTSSDEGTCASSSRHERSGYTVSEYSYSVLNPIFEQYNEELYQFLEDNQYTFPRFEKIAIERG